MKRIRLTLFAIALAFTALTGASAEKTAIRAGKLVNPVSLLCPATPEAALHCRCWIPGWKQECRPR